MNATFDLACSLTQAGVSVIPILPDGSKRPAVKWKPFQERIATEEELREMFTGEGGLAAIAGRVSGELECLDFEARSLSE